MAAGVLWYLGGQDDTQVDPDVVDTPSPEPTVTEPTVMGPGNGTWTVDQPEKTEEARAEAICEGCDVVVVTVCSLRRDYVGLYAGDDDLTPHLDAFAADAYRLENAYAASNFTLAGLTAVLTGRFGASTGVTGWDKGLVTDVPTLPEVLGIYGYRTGAFTTDAPSGFRPDYGLDRGFQHMEIIPPPRDNPDGAHQGGDIGPGGAAARPAAAWIAEQPTDVPMFVMFHTRTAHYPFVIENDPDDPTGVTQLLWESGIVSNPVQGSMPGTAGGTAQRGVVKQVGGDPVQEGVRAAGDEGLAMWKQRYRESVQRTDTDIEVFTAALEERGRLDKTVFILLSDHGESLGDHGELLHGDAYFDGVIHIPFFIKLPGRSGGEVEALASQVDLLPTVLDLVGAAPPAGIDGASLVPVLEGQAELARHRTLVEGGVSWHDDGELRGAMISPPWALLRQDMGCGPGAPRTQGPASCLYDLGKDPGQENNVAAENPEVVRELMESWAAFTESRAPGQQKELDPAFVEELRRTGYDFRPLDED